MLGLLNKGVSFAMKHIIDHRFLSTKVLKRTLFFSGNMSITFYWFGYSNIVLSSLRVKRSNILSLNGGLQRMFHPQSVCLREFYYAEKKYLQSEFVPNWSQQISRFGMKLKY